MKVLVRHGAMHVLASISFLFAYLYIINSDNVTGKVSVSNPLIPLIHKVSEANIPYPTAFPYGNGMVLHFYQQQESSTTKTVHRVINKGL